MYEIRIADRLFPEVARIVIEIYKAKKKGSFCEFVFASGMSTLTLFHLPIGEIAIDDGQM